MKGFENLLDNDEEIKWINGVEKFPFILKKINISIYGYILAD